MASNFYKIVVDGYRYHVEIMDSTHLRWKVLANMAGTSFTPTPWCTPQHVGQLNYLWETALKACRIMSSNGALHHFSENLNLFRSVAA